MKGFKTFLTSSALAAVIAAGGLAATTGTASADVACNRYGDCWHVSHRYNNYPSELRIQFHSDNWGHRHQDHRHYWRDNPQDDHGYYDHGQWRAFDHDHDRDRDRGHSY